MVKNFIFVYMSSKLMLQNIRLHILLILISFQHFHTKITNLQAWVCEIAFHSVLILDSNNNHDLEYLRMYVKKSLKNAVIGNSW
jgi:hypothetical protein